MRDLVRKRGHLVSLRTSLSNSLQGILLRNCDHSLIGKRIKKTTENHVAHLKQTILGSAWFVIQPLLNTIMFTIVFGHIAKLSADGLPPMLFYLSGSILWQYFANCQTATLNTFVADDDLLSYV